jgi:KDO2-lipid IV(A) lauroyltransferase
VDSLMARLRQDASGQDQPMFAKGARGARQAVAHLRGGGSLAMLVDQKLNDGIEARFFGLPAMTAPAAASLALHFRCPLVPARAERIGPARLRLVVEPPLTLPESGDRQADILALTQQINDRLEVWIRADPGSWLWLHRRWPKGKQPFSEERGPKTPDH